MTETLEGLVRAYEKAVVAKYVALSSGNYSLYIRELDRSDSLREILARHDARDSRHDYPQDLDS